MSEEARSELACPVCSAHALALDQPPQIDAMGVQVFSDMVGMGDLPTAGSISIVCRNCNTRWRDKEAFERGEAEPEPDVGSDAPESGGGDDGGE